MTEREVKRKKPGPLHVLSGRDEEILEAVYTLRYVTAQDVSNLLFSPSSLVYVRKRLSALAGGGDSVGNQYLYRFSLPRASAGNPRRVYTLGSRGRDYLAKETGRTADWYFRPHKVKHLSSRMVMHSLFLTHFLSAAKKWAQASRGYLLESMRTCYELAGEASQVELEDSGNSLKIEVIPDAWLLFRQRAGKKTHYPILLEIDRGTAYRQNFKNHVASRIAYVRKGGPYSRLFGTEAVVIAYATTGETAEYREARLKAMLSWTTEVLREQKRESWAPIFRFCSVDAEHVFETPLFDEALWYKPDTEKPVRLFGG